MRHLGWNYWFQMATTTCPEPCTLSSTLLYKIKIRHLFILKHEKLTLIVLTVSKFTEVKWHVNRPVFLFSILGFLYLLYTKNSIYPLYSKVTLVLATGKWKGKAGQSTEITPYNILAGLY